MHNRTRKTSTREACAVGGEGGRERREGGGEGGREGREGGGEGGRVEGREGEMKVKGLREGERKGGDWGYPWLL